MDLYVGWRPRLPKAAVAWNFLAEERLAASAFPAQRLDFLMGAKIPFGIHHAEWRLLKNFLHYVSKLAFDRG
jgi:hypothetical protein